MANGKKGPKMDKKVVKRLLDGLTTDENFRKRFQEDAAGTLASIGHEDPADGDSVAAGQCMQLQAGQELATAEEITADREKLERAMGGVFGFMGTITLVR